VYTYLGDFGASHRPPTVKKKNLAYGESAGGCPVGPWGLAVGGCTPPSAYLVVCAKLWPFDAFQFSPKLPLLLRLWRVCGWLLDGVAPRLFLQTLRGWSARGPDVHTLLVGAAPTYALAQHRGSYCCGASAVGRRVSFVGLLRSVKFSPCVQKPSQFPIFFFALTFHKKCCRPSPHGHGGPQRW